MAGFVVSPNTVRVLIHWTLHGRPQLNVLHGLYSLAGPLNPNIADNIFNLIAPELATTGYGALLASTTVLSAVGVLDLRSPDVAEIRSSGTAVPGTGPGFAMPDSTSLVLTERTAKTGRAHRGRIYTLGWIQTAVDAAGLVPQGAANSAVAWYTQVNAAMTAQSAPLAIRSTAKPDRPAHDGTTLPAKPYEITPVTVIEARDLIWDSNRRRADQLHR